MTKAPRKPSVAQEAPDAGSPDLFGKPQGEEQAKPSPAAEDHRVGHRARLRSRFMNGGLDAVQDYELLELILFRAIPRRDVKPLAKRLLARFHDIAGVIAARVQLLRQARPRAGVVGGDGERPFVRRDAGGAVAQVALCVMQRICRSNSAIGTGDAATIRERRSRPRTSSTVRVVSL